MPIKTLLVDDERSILDQAEIFLEKLSQEIDIHTAISADKALEMMGEKEFDVLVSDYQMPETNGLEFLEEMRRGKNSDIPFIMFTGKGREDVAIKALNLGADRYLQKGGEPRTQYKVLIDAIKQETSRYHAMDELKDKRERLNFLELATDTTEDLKIAVVDEDYRYKVVNQWYVTQYDLDKKELIGMSVSELLGEETFKEDIKPHLDRAFEGEEIEYSSWFEFSSSQRYMNVRYNPIKEEGEVESVAIISRDLTDRKKAEERIEENKKKIERLHEISAELQTCKSEEEVYSFAVEAAKEILDFSSCVIYAPKNDEIKEALTPSGFPEEKSLMFKPIEDSIYGTSVLENRSFFIKDLERREDVISPTDRFKSGMGIPIGDFSVFQVLSTEKDFFDKEDLKTAELLISHVSQALNRIQVKEREKFLHSLLRHDVGNKAKIVSGYLDLMEYSESIEEVEGYREKTKKTVMDAINMIEKIRNLRKIRKEGVISEMQLSSVINRVSLGHQGQLQERDINMDVGECDFKVKGGPLLEELFSSLIGNSIQHSDCDEIRISSQIEKNECIVTVEDDGIGISDEMKEKIFEKGFKDGESSGSGLGLYLVKEIAESYGGSVEVKDSELGGARFDIHLKRSENFRLI